MILVLQITEYWPLVQIDYKKKYWPVVQIDWQIGCQINAGAVTKSRHQLPKAVLLRCTTCLCALSHKASSSSSALLCLFNIVIKHHHMMYMMYNLLVRPFSQGITILIIVIAISILIVVVVTWQSSCPMILSVLFCLFNIVIKHHHQLVHDVQLACVPFLTRQGTPSSSSSF